MTKYKSKKPRALLVLLLPIAIAAVLWVLFGLNWIPFTNHGPERLPIDIDDLNVTLSMELPGDTICFWKEFTDLRSSDSTRSWLLFSQFEIKMPHDKSLHGEKKYLSLPMGVAVEIFEARIGKGIIKKPSRALISTWEDDEFVYNGTLVHAENGFFFLADQYRKRK